MISKTAICIISRRPAVEWLSFLNQFELYDTFIMADDNTQDFAALYNPLYPHVRILQVPNEKCYENHYIQTSVAANLPEVISWDKALYYFKHVETGYDKIWFMEDDVFFHSENVLLNIDTKYPDSDLLTPYHQVNERGEMYSWEHWINVRGRIALPWCRSMICACRLSADVLTEIDEYLQEKGKFFFIESMFNTLAHQSGLKIDCPEEMRNLHFDTKWDRDAIDVELLYHPFKKMEDHEYIRSK